MRSNYLVLLAGAMSALMACGPDTNNTGDTAGTDATSGSDVVRTDTVGTDATGTDSSTGRDSAVVMGNCSSTALSGTCAASVDLNAMGTALTMGTGRTITGNNCGAPEAAPSGIVGPSCATADDGTSHAGHVVVFDYTMQGSGGLSASTAVAGTETALDTVVWIVDGCTATSTELGCADDSGDGSQSTATTNGVLAAGTHVKIFVAGYTPPVLDGATNTGTFQLEVRELAANPAGGACSMASPLCVTGYTCVPAAGGTTGTCNADGTEGAHCLTTGTACTGNSAAGTPLCCSEMTPTAATPGFCLGVNPSGGVCTSQDPLCATGSSCIADMGSTTMGHCIADGAMGGACRMTAPACDGTLTCGADMTCM